MTVISFLRPIDQFNGKRRLLSELRSCLQSEKFDSFLIAAAFAKSGPLLRLLPEIEAWKKSKKSIKAIFGIDLPTTDVTDITNGTAYDFKFTLNKPALTQNRIDQLLFHGPKWVKTVQEINPR
jgi:hypothetical protein